MKTITKSIYLTFASVALACFALLPRAQAATPELLPAPAPDGFYKGFNTAEGLNALFSLTTGTFNSAFGFSALKADTTGGSNTAVGGQALLHNNTGGYNTAVGENALVFNTSGSFNMALGQGALANNLIGNNNTAMGFQALLGNTADEEVAVGYQALRTNTTGQQNTAVGFQALYNNKTSSTPDVNGSTVGEQNTAIGYQALLRNTTGFINTATGDSALLSNTTGWGNTANGVDALTSNTTGTRNTAIGGSSFNSNITGFRNTAVGFGALFTSTTGNLNSALGWQALSPATATNTTGSFNIAVGYKAGESLTTGDNNIYVGNLGGGAGEANTIRIGNQVAGTDSVGFPHPAHTATYIAGIAGVNQGSPAAVYINTTTGQLGTQAPASSLRFKHDIKAMDKTSDAILALKPVTFHYKSDTKNTPQFGLIAEQVAKVNPDLVVRDEKGEIYSVRYDAVNAMLLNEFLKEHRKVQELTSDFQATVAQLTSRLDEQAAQVQRVSAQLEASKPAPQVAKNNR